MAIADRLAWSGLALFVVGLMLGFVLQRFANPRAALSAHLNGVQSGTALIVIGLMWPRLQVWPSVAEPLSHVIWLSFWLLQAGLTVNAAVKPGEKASREPLKLVAGGLQMVSAPPMVLALGALLLTFRSAQA
jgi:hydroxylaminobenzene mutase